MSGHDKQQDLLRELEIESILEETHYLADQEKMEQTAQKYRAKPKMDEIFSNADKKPRLKNKNPLDEVDTTNTIVGEKTAATMQASLMMDGSNEDVKTPEEAQAEAEKKAEEARKKAEQEAKEAAAKAEAEENKIVTLTPEYDENTSFSGEVLGEVDQFKDDTHIESINSIDIELEDEEAEKQENDEQSKYEQLFGIKNDSGTKPPKKVVAKVPVYRPDEPREILNVKAGRFSEVVENEYEEYIRSKNPSVIAHVIRPEPKIEE